MSITLTFGCGHHATVPASIQTAPRCPTCGETRVSRVASRPPSFRGTVTGPHAEYAALDPMAVSLAPQGPLTLKAQD